MNRLRAMSIFLAIVVGSSIHVAAQSDTETLNQKSVKTLVVGAPSPAISVEKFLKGEPIHEFKKGHVYVVEFWAKWCGPCIEEMPHLSELQAEYKDQDVTIIGVNIRELRRSGQGWEDSFDEQTQEEVKKFVEREGVRMSYTVAYDGEKKQMDKAWMPSNEGIPKTFIVDQAGKIAWIGHPAVVRMPLDEVVKGTWDYETGPDRVKIAEDAYLGALRLFETNGEDALAAWEQAERDYPILALDLVSKKFSALISADLCDAASAAGKVYVNQAVERQSIRALNGVAWSIVNPSNSLTRRDVDLALIAAEKANELSNGEDAGVLDTLARVHFTQGQLEQAIKIQTKAVEIADDDMKKSLKLSLNEYLDSRD